MKSLASRTLADDWDPASTRSAVVGIAVTNAGAQVIAVQPAWVQSLADQGQLGAAAAGYVASAEMAGIALATFAMVLLVGRVPWRPVLTGALALIVCGNVLSVAFADNLALFRLLRFVTGVGAGTCVTLGFTIIGRTKSADRNFGLCIVGTLSYATIVFQMVPWLRATGGLPAFCLLFATVAAAVLPLARYGPAGATAEASAKSAAPTAGWSRRWAGLAAFLFYFGAQGAFWTYAELVGTARGLGAEVIARHLATSQVAGLAGAMTTVLLGGRLGRRWPVVVGLLMGIAPALALRGTFDASQYGWILAIHSFGWNMTHPLLLGVVASFGGGGRYVTYAVGMHKLGLATGPAVAAFVLQRGGYPDVFGVAALGFTACLLLSVLATRTVRRG